MLTDGANNTSSARQSMKQRLHSMHMLTAESQSCAPGSTASPFSHRIFTMVPDTSALHTAA